MAEFYGDKMKDLPEDTQVGLFQNLDGLPEQTKRTFINELANKDYSQAAIANMVMEGSLHDKAMAKEIVSAKKMLRTKSKDGGLPVVKKKDIGEPIYNYMGGAIMDGRNQEAALDLVHAHYMKSLRESNEPFPDKDSIDADVSGSFFGFGGGEQKSKLKQSFDKVIGEPFEFNGRKILAPTGPTKEGTPYNVDDVEATLLAITPEKLKSVFGSYPVNVNGEVVDVGKEIHELQLVPYRKNKFILEFKDEVLNREFKDPKKRKPYIIDLPTYFEKHRKDSETLFERGWRKLTNPNSKDEYINNNLLNKPTPGMKN